MAMIYLVIMCDKKIEFRLSLENSVFESRWLVWRARKSYRYG